MHDLVIIQEATKMAKAISLDNGITYMTAEEALKYGLIDEIIAPRR